MKDLHSKNPGQRAREIPSFGFIRLPQVLAVFPVSRTTWLNGVKSGKFPKPVRLGPATVAWRVEDIRALIDSVSGEQSGGSSGGTDRT